MTNTVKISCQLGTTHPSVPLGFEAWVDDQKFFDTEHVQELQTISIDIDDDEAEHELRFVLKNKTPEHTLIDDAGDIISDARLTISDITFDEIKPGHIITELAVYHHDFNGTGAETEEKFYGEIGCNGTVSLKFVTPVYQWLLDHM